MRQIAHANNWADDENHYPQADGTCFYVYRRDQYERSMVGGGEYAAYLIGWGDADKIAYGDTPEQAIERFKAGKFF